MKKKRPIDGSDLRRTDAVYGTAEQLEDGMIHKWELSRNLEHLANTPNADRVGNNAAFVCPMCQHVYIVSNGCNLGDDVQKEQGWRPCPKCGESIARVTEGGLKGTGRAWIEWPVKKGGE